jgi:hypothetical protein
MPHEAARRGKAIDALQAQCCTAPIAARKRFRGAGLKNNVDSVVSLHGAEVSDAKQPFELHTITCFNRQNRRTAANVRRGLPEKDLGR